MGLRRLATIGLGLALLLALPGRAAAADAKIGFVDQRKAVFSSHEGKDAEKKFGEIVEARWEKLRPRRDDLQRLREEYEKQKYVLSEDALQERQIDIMKRQRELERDSKELEEDLQIEQVKLLQPIQKKLQDLVAQIGKEQGLTLIIDKNAPSLLYFDDSLDVTDLLIEKLNKP
jgi:outer membrane protein